MPAHIRTLLLIAFTAALSPVALAQTATPLAYDGPPPRHDSTPPAETTQSTNDQATTAPPAARAADADDWKDAGQPAMPTQAQAAAGHPASGTGATFATLDADHDGRVSTNEAAADAGFVAAFATMDANHDAFVSDAEYRAYAKVDTAQGAEHAAPNSAVVARDAFATLDADHDGRISAAEASADAGFGGSFAAMDSNGDGFVTDAEYRAHAKATEKPNRP
jgi:hypothetical protein